MNNKRLVTGLIVALSFASFLAAQRETVQGVVLLNERPPGARAQQVEVELTTDRGDIAYKTMVNESGEYKFGGLYLGNYKVTARAPGFKPATVRITLVGESQRQGDTTLYLVEQSQLPTINHDGEVISRNALQAPKQARKEVQRGEEAFATGAMNESKEAVEKALNLYPDYARAWYLRARISEREGRRQEAAADYERVLARDPDFYPAYGRLSELYRILAIPGELKRVAEEWRKLQPLDAVPYYYVAVAHYEAGDYAVGLREAEAAYRLPHASLPHLLLVLANCHIKLRNPDAAAVHLVEFLSQHPDDPLAGQAKETLEQLRQLPRE